jgi:hypothetical protein
MGTRTIEEHEVEALQIVRQLLPWREQLSGGLGTGHGNARLELIDVLIVMLAAFFNPMVRTQRLIDALSSQKWMQEKSGVGRIPRSTFSDALRRFDPEPLRPLIQELAAKVPALRRRDGDLAWVTRQILAVDGTFFNLAGEVALAMLHRRGNTPQVQSRMRLNLHLDIDSFTPVDMSVNGGEGVSEPEALRVSLRPGVIYVADRAFLSFALLREILAKDSNFVIRMKQGIGFESSRDNPLTPRDLELEIRSDTIGRLPGPQSPGNSDSRSSTCRPPAQELRRVVAWDSVNQKEVVLLTDMLDVPALAISELYRRRWTLELFFKWLKCWAGFDHAISQDPRGLTLQFYVAVIGTLLLHLATGRRVSKYAIYWIGAVASGQAASAEMVAGLARIEREKELERARLARKRAQKKPA